MFKRIRHLHISLAAKCQLLFGAAVVLIIAAALFVPWQRMEQLMMQLDERSANTLADRVLQEHLATGQLPVGDPSLLPIQPVPAPARAAGRPFAPPRLLPVPEELEQLPRFERAAMSRFLEQPVEDSFARYYDRPDGTQGYRFARALYATQSCLQCHELGNGGVPLTGDVAADAAVAQALVPDDPPDDAAATLHPDDEPAAAPAATALPRPAPHLLGLLSVDMPSHVDPSQLLLNRIVILIAGLLAGTLAIIVFYLITTRLILQPVRVLQETAEKVSEGDLNIRSDISTGDEFQQLSETFNTMLANLKKGEDQLRAINKSLDLKLGQLAESNVALYESNRLKSEFLANVSHELRTPLNSILGFAELLRDTSTPHDARTARYVNNILNSGQNLLDLINDLLDLAKIEAGRMEVRSEPLSLPDLFEGLSSILRPLAETKQVRIVTAVAPDVPIMHTDPAKLQQILYNFLSNAIKFSPPGEFIELSADRIVEGSIRISVSDNGPGIAPEQQQVIFEKFRQIDGSVTRQHSGTGLGLAIARELAMLLNGTIGVRSTPGAGATFWLIVPPRIEARSQDLRHGLVHA